jgi:hypothetical protein
MTKIHEPGMATILPKMVIFTLPRLITVFLLASLALSGCTQANGTVPDTPLRTPGLSPTQDFPSEACQVTEPVRAKPPEDAAVQNEPRVGNYYVNDDRSIWASAWWTEAEGYPLRADKDGVKVGWYRPEGAELEITGRRMDGNAPPLEAHVPCCYPTRFQATGLYFPASGCWEVTARAAESVLSFVVWVEP